jgi:hypothetical protein
LTPAPTRKATTSPCGRLALIYFEAGGDGKATLGSITTSPPRPHPLKGVIHEGSDSGHRHNFESALSWLDWASTEEASLRVACLLQQFRYVGPELLASFALDGGMLRDGVLVANAGKVGVLLPPPQRFLH